MRTIVSIELTDTDDIYIGTTRKEVHVCEPSDASVSHFATIRGTPAALEDLASELMQLAKILRESA